MNSVNLKTLLRIFPNVSRVRCTSNKQRNTRKFGEACPTAVSTARWFCSESDGGRGKFSSKKESVASGKNTVADDDPNESAATLDRLGNSNRESKKGSSAKSWEVPQYLKEKYAIYQEKDAEIILDVQEEMELMEESPDYEEYSRKLPVEPEINLNYKRGTTGVYDLEDLVEALKAENAQDICVIRIPKELLYAEYFVIVSGKSTRHIQAIAAFIKKLYKRKRTSKDAFVIVQGKDSENWAAVDMGNIVLHIFSPDERAKFDIETLWTVGAEFDDNCRKKQSTIVDKYQQQLRILNSMQPLSSHDYIQPQDVQRT